MPRVFSLMKPAKGLFPLVLTSQWHLHIAVIEKGSKPGQYQQFYEAPLFVARPHQQNQLEPHPVLPLAVSGLYRKI